MHTRVLAQTPTVVPKELWDREYEYSHSIPSSARQEPAKGLLLFAEILQLQAPLRVLDAGCGNGRNSVYLAKKGCDVTAVDFSEPALLELHKRAAALQLTGKIDIINGRIDGRLPFPNEAFDLTLDCYTSCHFLSDEPFERFWREMGRVTRRGGHLLSLLFPPRDGYYARYLDCGDDEQDKAVVTDPVNGISKKLYSDEEAKAFFLRYFDLPYFAAFEFDDVVLGEKYRRVVLSCVMQKR